jgi:hypothetical protein
MALASGEAERCAMQIGIEVLTTAVGCGLAMAMARLMIEGLFRITFGRRR